MTSQPYAECTECHSTFKDRNEVNAHMDETLQASDSRESHTVAVRHATSDELAQRKVGLEVQDAIQNCIMQLAQSGVAYDNISKGLRAFPDFADAWTDWIEDNK